MDQNFQPEEGGSKAPVIIGVAVVVILIVLGLYFWLGSSSTDVTPPETNTPATNTPPVDNNYVQSVNVRHQFKSGTHTYVGSIDLSTPCETLTTEVVPTAAGSKLYTLKFTSTKTSEVCAEVKTTKSFKVTLKGTSDIKLDAYGSLNGKQVRLNVFEVRPDQDIDNYDIYIKG